MGTIENRYDVMFFFDVKDGNPNGDPDADNLPRMDVETGQGLMSDCCLKRKARNYVDVAKGNSEGFKIFIREKAILNRIIDEAYEDESVKKHKDPAQKVSAARELLCKRFYDIRTFGAVMSTGKNAGQVRGPIQFTFGRSVDPITSQYHSITRMAVTTEDDSKKQEGINQTFGHKSTIPYGLYVAHIFISANLAKQTGFTEEDLSLFWEALKNMFDLDRSAARGLMSAQKIIVFKHDSVLGNAPANKLFDLVHIHKKDLGKVTRCFDDYEVVIDKELCPSGVEIIEML